MRALVAVFLAGCWVGGWVVGAILVAAGYFVECWWFPYGTCWRCRGKRRYRSSFSKGTRKCKRCGGSGERLRVGRRIVVSWRAVTAE